MYSASIVIFIAPIIGTFESFESGHCLFDLTSPGANPKNDLTVEETKAAAPKFVQN